MKITLIASTTCAYSAAALKIVRTAEFRAWLKESGHTIVAVDVNSAAGKAALKACGCKGACKTPVFCIAAEKPYSISYRPAKGEASAADLIAKLGAACGSCNWKPSVCPTCKRALGCLLPLGLLASMLFTGCVVTKGACVPKPAPEPPEISFFRVAFLYPFSVEDVTFPGGVALKKYGTSGGAAELVPLVDASGKLVGTMIGSGAKAVVAP
jgi:hypothetical protein